MSPVRMANAIVYFRLLRSVGKFRRVGKTAAFTFCPCKCGHYHAEELPNGVPDPAAELNLGRVIDEFGKELGTVCLEHFTDQSV